VPDCGALTATAAATTIGGLVIISRVRRGPKVAVSVSARAPHRLRGLTGVTAGRTGRSVVVLRSCCPDP
jgi:hypothetical protein